MFWDFKSLLNLETQKLVVISEVNNSRIIPGPCVRHEIFNGKTKGTFERFQ